MTTYFLGLDCLSMHFVQSKKIEEITKNTYVRQMIQPLQTKLIFPFLILIMNNLNIIRIEVCIYSTDPSPTNHSCQTIYLLTSFGIIQKQNKKETTKEIKCEKPQNKKQKRDLLEHLQSDCTFQILLSHFTYLSFFLSVFSWFHCSALIPNMRTLCMFGNFATTITNTASVLRKSIGC